MTARMSILLVEDDLNVARATRRLLGRDHDVSVAHSVSEAVAALAARSYEAVISDFNLGDDTGDVVLAYAAAVHPEARRVLYSGSADCGRAVGLAHAVVDKPATLAELVAALEVR